MKAEQVVTSVYVVLGIIFAYVSSYFTKSFSNIFFAISIPFLFYALSIGPLFKIGKLHKRKMLISNSLVTFFFVWLVAWIIFFNF
jgi:hypothetical protein